LVGERRQHAADKYIRAATFLSVVEREARREAMDFGLVDQGAPSKEDIERHAING